MSSKIKEEKPIQTPWITGLANVLKFTDQRIDPRLRTTISCQEKSGKSALFLPPEMSSLQPESLRYLHTFARYNNCRLIEDRRTVDIQPIVENRNVLSPDIRQGVSLLLKQTGLQGIRDTLSKPHRLLPESAHRNIATLIRMAALAVPESKRVVLLPNRYIVNLLKNDTHPIMGHACNVVSADSTIKLGYFESPGFKSVGYQTEKQFIMHVFLAGGPVGAPKIWTHRSTLSSNVFRFQLFQSTRPGHDFGLMYTTLFLDIDSEAQPASTSNSVSGTVSSVQ